MYTQAQLETLNNFLLASAQADKITAAKHRQFEDAIIGEMFDPQSRGDLFNLLDSLLSYDGSEQIFVIKAGVAKLLPASLLPTGGGSSLTQATVTTTGGVITLDMNSQAQRMFKGSATIAATKTWQLSNTTGALKIESFIFAISGLYAQTMPSNFKMSDARWNSGAKTWTPMDTGLYNASAVFDGTSWLLSIEQNSGPFI